MSVTESVVCSNCGAPTWDDSPLSVCGRCLLVDAVAHTRIGEKTPAPGETISEQAGSITPSHGASRLPEMRELQELFPDMEFLELLGAGGMGAVYKARQVSLDRMVAFKLLNPALGKETGAIGGSEFVERFRREAKAMARLRHPNVAELYEFGERGSFHYLIMEFVDGADLQKLMATEKLDLNMVLELVPQLCAALSYAHEKGVTHRDIKPANILVDKAGVVKVADFGLARVYRGGDTLVALTNVGQVMGTPFYMAPEQLTDPEHVDQRADIYSLGVVVYQMLTGILPQGNFSPPSAICPKLGKTVDRVIMRALAHAPENRFRDVSELQRALQTSTTEAGGVVASGRRGKTFALLGISGLLVAAVLLQPWNRPGSALPGKETSFLLNSKATSLPGMRLIKGLADFPTTRPLGEVRLSSNQTKAIEALFVHKIWRQTGPSSDIIVPGGFAVDFQPDGRALIRWFAQEEWGEGNWRLLSDGGVVFWGGNPDYVRLIDFSSPTRGTCFHVRTDPSNPESFHVDENDPQMCWMVLHRGQRAELTKEMVPRRGRWQSPAELPKVRPVPDKNLSENELRFVSGWFVGRTLTTVTGKPLEITFNSSGSATIYNFEGDKQVRNVTWKLLSDGGISVRIPSSDPNGLLFDLGNPLHGTVYKVVEQSNGELKPDTTNPSLWKTTVMAPSTGQLASINTPGLRLFTDENRLPLTRPLPEPKLSSEQAEAIKALFVNKTWRVPLKGYMVFRFEENGHVLFRGFGFEEWLPASWELLPDGGVVFSLPDGFLRILDFSNELQATCYKAVCDMSQDRCFRLDTETPMLENIFLHQGTQAELDDGLVPKRGRWASSAELPKIRPVPGILFAQISVMTEWFEGHTFSTSHENPMRITFMTGGNATIHNLQGDRRDSNATWKILPDGGVALRVPEHAPSGLMVDFRSYTTGTVYRVISSQAGEFRIDDSNPALQPISNDRIPSPRSTNQTIEPPPTVQSQEKSPNVAPVPPPLDIKQKPFENSLGMKFVPVPGTNVLFCIHETRRKDYAAFAKETPGVNPRWQELCFEGFVPAEGLDEHPVWTVTSKDAETFCAWLGQKEKKTYRLPTDREWSVAVGLGRKEKWRKGDTPESVDKDPSVYPWGAKFPPPMSFGNYSDESRKRQAPGVGDDCIPGYEDGFPSTAPVMSFQPNEFGIYDLGGNVWEWVSDLWNDTEILRVSRGGCWIDSGQERPASSYRWATPPDTRYHTNGFRVVLVVE